MIMAFVNAYLIYKTFVYSVEVLTDGKIRSAFSLLVKMIAIQRLIVSVIAGYLLINSSGEAGRDYTYDDFVKRYNRARNEVVEMIKTKKLTNAQAKEAIAAYEQIGKIIQGARTYRGPLDFLFNTLNPKDRRAKTSIERQQAIEDLMSNELFVASLRAELALAGL